jgi:hypothetical protein
MKLTRRAARVIRAAIVDQITNIGVVQFERGD